MKIKKQNDIKNCGLIVLQAFYKYFYDKWIPLNEFKKDAFYSQDGIVIKNLENISKKWGMHLEAFQGDYQSFMELKIDKPIALIIEEANVNHFVILLSVGKKYLTVLDPLYGKRRIGFDLFKKIYKEIIVVIEKIPGYIFNKKEGDIKKQNPFLYLFRNKNIYKIFLSLLFIALLNFTSSFFIKIIIDKAIPFKNQNLLFISFGFFLWILIFKTFQIVCRAIWIKKIQIKIEKEIYFSLFDSIHKNQNSQLMKLDANDYLRRIALIPNIAHFVANFTFLIFCELFTFLISISILIWIDIKIFLIIFISGILIFAISFWKQKFLFKKHPQILSENMELIKKQNNIIFSVDKLKLIENYQYSISEFEKAYDQNLKVNFNLWKTSLNFDTIISFIMNIIPMIIILLSTLFVMRAELSIGKMFLFITFSSFFLSPLESLSYIFGTHAFYLKEYELIEFLLNCDKEIKGIKNIDKIRNITFSNFTYSYDNLNTSLRIKNLQINNNLIVEGNNASGKSTLLKIINLDLDVDENFKINSLEKKYINQDYYREKICFIKNNSFIPNDSIIKYVTNNNKEKIRELFYNIEFYNLTDLLIKYKIDLNKEMINNAQNLSSGQRQFIEILKLFTKKYDLILLDEAFENIDSILFEEISKRINDYQNQAITIEVSHSKKYLRAGNVIEIANI